MTKAAEWSPPDVPAGKTRAASKEKEKEQARSVDKIMVYCQVSNEEAKSFYVKKAGFVEKETSVCSLYLSPDQAELFLTPLRPLFSVENYYHKIEPRAAILLERDPKTV